MELGQKPSQINNKTLRNGISGPLGLYVTVVNLYIYITSLLQYQIQYMLMFKMFIVVNFIGLKRLPDGGGVVLLSCSLMLVCWSGQDTSARHRGIARTAAGRRFRQGRGCVDCDQNN